MLQVPPHRTGIAHWTDIQCVVAVRLFWARVISGFDAPTQVGDVPVC